MKSSKSEPVKNQSDIALAEEQILLGSQQQPAWHVVVLSFFTLGAYNMFWLYRNLNNLSQGAKQLQDSINGVSSEAHLRHLESPAEAPEPDSNIMTAQELEDAHIRLGRAGTLDTYLKFSQARPILTTALFAIPIVNLLVLLGFGHMSAQLVPDRESFVRKNSQFSGFVVALLFGALTLLSVNLLKWLPEPLHLLYLSSSISLAAVQVWLNRHWKLVEDNKRLARQAFSPLELVAIVLGAAWIGLIVVHQDLKPGM
ncbi:hypothetical protein BH11CYA1_BH11CYA1_05540 [soil metagenome]